MDTRKQIDYWLTTADADIATAKTILKSGKNYHYSLFFCHLALEKYLKALVVKKTADYPPRIHDLELLAEKGCLQADEIQLTFLREMTEYNIEARYPDEQFEIYKKVNESLTRSTIKKTEEYLEWIKNSLK